MSYFANTFVEPTSIDLQDESFEDTRPADIIQRMATVHGYHAQCWEQHTFWFVPTGGAEAAAIEQEWFINVASIEVQRSVQDVWNAVYAVHSSGRGWDVRTDYEKDVASIGEFGFERQYAVSTRTTDSTEAEDYRDAYLADNKDYSLRAAIVLDSVEDAYGARHPIYAIRAGSIVTLRNIPTALSTALEGLRKFNVGTTEYTTDGTMRLEPLVPIPTLVTLIAQKEVGVTRREKFATETIPLSGAF